ncbi:MAG: transcription elongation factor GreB [Deltaproteobacteria bacterium]|nr:transcription elongation factor GreB [Deltaproteobacteria bacterium]
MAERKSSKGAHTGAKSDYITPAGYRKLAREMDYLWRDERPRVTQQVSDAAALGDRSENADYIYGKKRLREIDRRLGFLGKRLDVLTVVQATAEQLGRAFFGAHVTVEDEEGQRATYQIVGPDEVEPAERRISINSPMGRALLGKGEGDEVRVRRPKGEGVFEVVAIRYEGVR